MERRSLGRDRRAFGAEIATKDGQGLGAGGSARHDKRIVIPRNREDGRWIVPEWIVKLIIIELRFPEIIDHVAEMKEKCWTIGGIGRVGVGRKLIGYINFVAVVP